MTKIIVRHYDSKPKANDNQLYAAVERLAQSCESETIADYLADKMRERYYLLDN